MNLRSLGYRTDLIFARFSGEITDCGHYMVVRTPSNPTFYWGNFVLFDRPPNSGDLEDWLEVFAKEIPYAKHIAIGWDGQEPGDTEAFVQAGLEFDPTIVMTATEVHAPPKVNLEATYRMFDSDDDWAQLLELGLLCNDDGYEPEGYRVFLQCKNLNRRRMGEAGLGNWFGAFLEGRLVCGMGLYSDAGFEGDHFDGDRVARFQSVETHPDFRRRGLCGSLVYHVATHGLEVMKARTLVMCADPEYHAARIYESVGFRPTERQYALQKRSERDLKS
jgi:GNAT superfamily N-acetyltransferase